MTTPAPVARGFFMPKIFWASLTEIELHALNALSKALVAHGLAQSVHKDWECQRGRLVDMVENSLLVGNALERSTHARLFQLEFMHLLIGLAKQEVVRVIVAEDLIHQLRAVNELFGGDVFTWISCEYEARNLGDVSESALHHLAFIEAADQIFSQVL